MQAEDEAIFGALFGQTVKLLPPGWAMSVGTLVGVQPNARYRALAANDRENDFVTTHGPTELAALAKLHRVLAEKFRR